MNKPLASYLESVPHISVFDDLVEERISSINAGICMVNLIDTAPESILPYLASQFHVEGYEGYTFADTTEKKRNLIRKSIELHRYKGTPWSIKEALKTVGYDRVSFQEGINVLLDGSWNLDGSKTLGSENWAHFIAYVEVEDPLAVTDAQKKVVAEIINEYKPVRCHCDDIIYTEINAG